jgi:hypothetical protein
MNRNAASEHSPRESLAREIVVCASYSSDEKPTASRFAKSDFFAAA